MTAKISIMRMIQKPPREGLIINTCSNAKSDWESDLSPFIIGPCRLYSGKYAKLMENLWQYCKVYRKHTKNGEPTDEYFEWAKAGWADPKPQRYPMGRGAVPEYSWWAGEKLGYIEARKRIYIPQYVLAVKKRSGWKRLKKLYQTESHLWLRDWDGYDHGDVSLDDVADNQHKKMGHSFVLKMMLLEHPLVAEYL